MRKIFGIITIAGMLSLSAVSGSIAAPVAGFEAQYSAVVAACASTGDAASCRAALTAYSSALVAAGIAPDVALASLRELRADVAAAGGDLAIFDELLPETAATTPPAPDETPAGDGEGAPAGDGGGTPASPS
jgi:hypothetical protein